MHASRNLGTKRICFVGVMMSDALPTVNEIKHNWNQYYRNSCLGYLETNNFGTKIKCINKPFAQSGHMVQKHTFWNPSFTVGHSKQRQVKVDWYELLCFGKSHCATCVQACLILYHVTGSHGYCLPLGSNYTVVEFVVVLNIFFAC